METFLLFQWDVVEVFLVEYRMNMSFLTLKYTKKNMVELVFFYFLSSENAFFVLTPV